jgi:L-asparaginase
MRITILTTGGTIEKTYNELEGSLRNDRSVLEEILGKLRLPDLFVRHVSVMHKDSLEMTDEDRGQIVAAVRDSLPASEAVIVLHGTDTLELTGEVLENGLAERLEVPVILTGAMRPYEFRDSDAPQNVTEALLAARLVEPGVYVAMHNRVLRFPGVFKDRQALSFRRTKGAGARGEG